MIGKKVDTYFFAEVQPTDLAIARILFYAFIFRYFYKSDFSVFADPSLKMAWLPISFFKYVPINSGSMDFTRALSVLWRCTLIFAVIGFCTPIAVFGSTLLGMFLIGLVYNYGKIAHSTSLPLLLSLILCFSRCGDAWSIDAIVKRRLYGLAPPQPSGHYLWPLRLIQIYTTWVYFSAAYQKLTLTGLAWVTSDNLQNLLHFCHRPFGIWVSNHPGLCHVLAAWTLIIELAAPMALVNRKLTLLIVPNLILLHVGTCLSMGRFGWFIPFEFAYIFWVPWGAFGRYLTSRIRPKSIFASRAQDPVVLTT